MTFVDESDGFTLLEMLIAFLILSGALAVSAQTIALATKSISIADERRDAARFAEALRAETLSHLLPGQQMEEGKSGVLHWKARRVSTGSQQANEKPAGFSVIVITSSSGREHKFLFFDAGLE
ncbi:type IV pilus modification PilV family protein [Neorhizobium sp. DT-125]|uniref:type IV pilus modification PilV family protein n=1 Tax=Neorhizobium sp. DT-125 TaxID=3396163 RepID=UPI003F1946BB